MESSSTVFFARWMSLESAAVFFKRFSTGERADDATALRRLGVMFSL